MLKKGLNRSSEFGNSLLEPTEPSVCQNNLAEPTRWCITIRNIYIPLCVYLYFRNYEIVAGTARWKALLHQKFPDETDAIDRYFEMVKETESFETLNGLLKLIPLWLAWIIGKVENLFSL